MRLLPKPGNCALAGPKFPLFDVFRCGNATFFRTVRRCSVTGHCRAESRFRVVAFFTAGKSAIWVPFVHLGGFVASLGLCRSPSFLSRGFVASLVPTSAGISENLRFSPPLAPSAPSSRALLPVSSAKFRFYPVVCDMVYLSTENGVYNTLSKAKIFYIIVI